MNPYSRPIDEVKLFFRKRSLLSTLILINAGIWVLTKVTGVVFFLYSKPGSEDASSWLLSWLALPSSVGLLADKPWSLVTYMFFHLDFFHILFNMLWLYWFGRIFLEYLSSRRLMTTYILGGIAGGLTYILAFNIFPVFSRQLNSSMALGASASVMAIVMAISFYVPRYTIQLLFLGRVRIIYLALILFVFDFFAIPSGNSGGHVAHIGGALWGFLYVLFLRKGKIFNFPGYNSEWISGLKKIFISREAKQKVHQRPYTRPRTDDEYNAEKLERQKKTDAILEKISRGGYDSLTKEEKAFLFRSSGTTK
jgi:membrane associated rhomboid family serine protease